MTTMSDVARSQVHNVLVGIKTWGELIEENRARLQFFQEHLQHTADESAAIRYLHEKHSKFLEGVLVEDAGEAEGEPAVTDIDPDPGEVVGELSPAPPAPPAKADGARPSDPNT